MPKRAAGRSTGRPRGGGALPVAMGGDFEAYWQAGGNKVAKAGMRARACSTRSPAIRCPMRCAPHRSVPPQAT
jgi:hypothetical protein